MTVEILRVHEDYVTKTMFALTEWLASSGGTKFLKSIKEMSKEELNVFLKSFYMSMRKKHGTSVYKSSSMKSI